MLVGDEMYCTCALGCLVQLMFLYMIPAVQEHSKDGIKKVITYLYKCLRGMPYLLDANISGEANHFQPRRYVNKQK
jgi:hypothetical protein